MPLPFEQTLDAVWRGPRKTFCQISSLLLFKSDRPVECLRPDSTRALGSVSLWWDWSQWSCHPAAWYWWDSSLLGCGLGHWRTGQVHRQQDWLPSDRCGAAGRYLQSWTDPHWSSSWIGRESSIQNWRHHCSIQSQGNRRWELWPFLVSAGFPAYPRQRGFVESLLWRHEERWHLFDWRLCSQAREVLYRKGKGWAFECSFSTNSDYSRTICSWPSESWFCWYRSCWSKWSMAKVDEGTSWPLWRVESRDC